MAKTKVRPAKEPEAKKEEPKTNLLPCTVARNFVDGNMAAEFGKLGYGVEWVKGEKRKLPMRLIERVRNSGGEIELLRG